MSQAFDEDCNPLGEMVHGASLKESFNKALELHPEAHSIMTSHIPIEEKRKINQALINAVREAI